MRRYVLDANALIGFFEGRLGVSEKVRRLLSETLRQDSPLLMSAVNWGEVFYLEWRFHGGGKGRGAGGRVGKKAIAGNALGPGRDPRGGAPPQKNSLWHSRAVVSRTGIDP